MKDIRYVLHNLLQRVPSGVVYELSWTVHLYDLQSEGSDYLNFEKDEK